MFSPHFFLLLCILLFALRFDSLCSSLISLCFLVRSLAATYCQMIAVFTCISTGPKLMDLVLSAFCLVRTRIGSFSRISLSRSFACFGIDNECLFVHERSSRRDATKKRDNENMLAPPALRKSIKCVCISCETHFSRSLVRRSSSPSAHRFVILLVFCSISFFMNHNVSEDARMRRSSESKIFV